MTTTTSDIKVMITTTLPIKLLRRMPQSEADDRRLKQLYSLLHKKFPGLKDKCSSIYIVSCK